VLPSRDSWFEAFRRWRVLAIVAIFGVLVVVYRFSGSPQERTITAFVLAPLLVGAFGIWQTTAWTAIGALVLSYVVWLVDSPVSGGSFAVRWVVVALGGVASVFAAWNRERQQAAAAAMTARAEVTASFVGQLIPATPRLSGFEVGVHYQPGEARLQLGGDFLDVAELDDGSAAFVIGDVCGHGPEAAALGVALRAGWRTAIRLLPPDPASWLEGLEASYGEALDETFVTVISGIVDPSGREAVVSSAGHPYPISLGATPTIHAIANDPPLGLVAGTGVRTRHTIALAQRPLLAFTDGLWESHRGADGETRATIDDVVAALASIQRSAGGELLERLTSHFRGPTGSFDDDVALLLIAPRAAAPEGA
jgi:serine phosphatase RsbU (regulator of sigma subunit)